jgi:hypothetical protein
MVKERFVRETDRNLFTKVDNVEDILGILEREPYANKDFVSKWG